ncbi:MAG: hypothetical protein ACREJX_14700, partial [Polyangiaceae bacterium]
GHVTKVDELARIERETKRIDKDILSIEKKLSSKNFAEKAPKEVVDEAHVQLADMNEAKKRLEQARKLADELEEKNA